MEFSYRTREGSCQLSIPATTIKTAGNRRHGRLGHGDDVDEGGIGSQTDEYDVNKQSVIHQNKNKKSYIPPSYDDDRYCTLWSDQERLPWLAGIGWQRAQCVSMRQWAFGSICSNCPSSNSRRSGDPGDRWCYRYAI